MDDRIRLLTMPKWGMTMTEGRIAGWLKAEGDSLTKGDELVEIETDKIANVVEAEGSGVLRRILVSVGQRARCGAPIAVIADAGVAEDRIDEVAASAETADPGEAGSDELRAARIPAGAIALNVVSAGSEAGAAPVVLLHGFGADASAWMFTQGALAAGGRVVHALDLPSHGSSDVSPDHADPAAMAGAVQAAVAALASGRVHLVGHSLGGRIALAVAAAMGDRVASVALIAPAGFGQPVSAEFLERFLSADRRRPMKEALGLLVADAAAISPEMVERTLAMKRGDGVAEALAAVAAAALGPGATDAGLGDLGRITAPLLVIWGTEDRVIPALVEGARLIAGCGHIPQMEAAAEVNALLAAHIADHDG